MVRQLLSAEQALLDSGVKVGAVGPSFIDEKNGSASRVIRHGWFRVDRLAVDQSAKEPVEADYLISSGSLIRASILSEIGPMRDELFIDWVDIEWGLRARCAGNRSFVVPDAVMEHSIGDAFVHMIGKDVNLHNDIRNYYIVRNATYLLGLKTMGWKWRTVTIPKVPGYVLFYSWHSCNRWNSLKLLCKAVSDGVRGRVGRLA